MIGVESAADAARLVGKQKGVEVALDEFEEGQPGAPTRESSFET